ncbi:MAG TPA: GntR family transcriptional regulator [Candidatus Dormibacteraeota bacterium]|nr:GntR family transcriptional regulator [Candidatus Dormibacteraeota bacterium]
MVPPPVDPSDPRPPYRRIADQLRDEIHSERLKPGDRLPSERQLLEQWGTAYATVRQALGLLKAEGLVDSVQGLGYFVRAPVPVIHRRGGTGHFVLDARAQGQEAEQRLLEVSAPREAPGDVAAQLDLPEGAQVVVRRYLLVLGDHPAQLADSYFPADLFRETRIAQHAHMPGGPHAEMQRALGWEIDHCVEDVTARMPSPQETQALRLSPGTPVIRILRTTYASGPGLEAVAPVEVTDYVLAADRHILGYDVPVRERWSEETQGWVPKSPPPA